MSESTSPIEHIKDRTRDAHESVEAAMSARFFDGEGIDAEGFRELLEAYFGLYATYDQQMAPVVEARLDEFPYLHRADRLARDLGTLGYTDAEIDALPTLPTSALPSPQTTPALLGTLYVVEGSALGNRVMRRTFERRLDEALLEADAFFHGDARATRRRWQQFRPLFDRRVDPGPRLDAATEAAVTTFAMYEEWLA